MSDEEIIKKRLLIDGDGTGDDRRLNMLLKQFLKWTYSKNESPENNQIVYDRLMAQLAQCQFAAAKNERTVNMIQEELQNYNKLADDIQKSIELAKIEIEESKKELVVAKQIRKNKMEYDMLARLIKEQPDREETKKQIEVIKKELNDLNEKKMKLDRKFEKRCNDFTVLMYAIRELEAQLEEEVSSDSDLESAKGDGNKTDDKHLMDVSDEDDDEEPETSTKKLTKKSLENNFKDTTESTSSKDVIFNDGEDSKENMSVDEDTVLELSIDKDENDVVKLDNGVTT